jgi:hypothetical protein
MVARILMTGSSNWLIQNTMRNRTQKWLVKQQQFAWDARTM